MIRHKTVRLDRCVSRVLSACVQHPCLHMASLSEVQSSGRREAAGVMVPTASLGQPQPATTSG